MAWATTPASAPCSMRVCGIRCLWGGEGPFLWAEVLGPCFSVCKRFLLSQPPGAQWGQLLSCLYLVLSPGRACEQLVDFCSPDLNPCQHDGQCVGTPDGPRSVLPISRAREGRGCQVSSPPPLLLPTLFPHLSSGLGVSHAGLLRVSVKGGHGDSFLARQNWGHSMDG